MSGVFQLHRMGFLYPSCFQIFPKVLLSRNCSQWEKLRLRSQVVVYRVSSRRTTMTTQRNPVSEDKNKKFGQAVRVRKWQS